MLLSVEKDKLNKIWIDNDYGLIFSGSSFLSNLEKDKDWDWRYGEED